MGKNDVNEFKKRLYSFTLKLIEFLDLLGKDNISNRLGDQLLRSGTSIVGNYAEGRSASSKKEFIQYLNVALKSANESKLWLGLLRDSKRAASEDTVWLLNELDEISNMLAASVLKLKGTR